MLADVHSQPARVRRRKEMRKRKRSQTNKRKEGK
jgi:hypothetical protein